MAQREDVQGFVGNNIRFSIACTYALAAVVLLWFLGPAKDMLTEVRLLVGGGNRPPSYESHHEQELLLSQHNPNLPFPEGRDGRYLYWKKHERNSGFNNVLQELMLNAFVAHASNRSFVFYNYQWRSGTRYSIQNGLVVPSQIPITAFLSGPIAGEPYYGDPVAPRSVGEDYFHKVCPHPKNLAKKDFRGMLGRDGGSGEAIVSHLLGLLATEDRCAQIPFLVFDMWIMGDPNRLLDLWPRYASSPILTEFRWSPLIETAFDTNRAHFAPPNASEPALATLPPQLPSAARYTPLPRLLALHVRRGDFEQHCALLADWHSGYTAFNSFPTFPDSLADAVPADVEGEERRAHVRRHCWPDIAQIVQRAEEVRAGADLRDVYVMTNGAREWVSALEDALRATGTWRTVASARGVRLSAEQVHVAQAVDMLVGQRAQVFVGNGWSSMSAQINLLRMANGLQPGSCRFW